MGDQGIIIIRRRRDLAKRGVLEYDAGLERFCLEAGDKWAPLRCGEAVGIRRREKSVAITPRMVANLLSMLTEVVQKGGRTPRRIATSSPEMLPHVSKTYAQGHGIKSAQQAP